MALLSMRRIRKSFGGTVANDDISIDVEAGEIRALLGENGAGKTTLMNILYGLYEADSGELFWKGRELGAHSPRESIAAGLGMVHQHFMLVPTLTVSQNVTLGLKSAGHPFPDRRKLDAKLAALSRLYGLDAPPAAKVASLSLGEQQRVEILKLLYRGAELLILDEPTAVLTPREAESFLAVLKRLKAEGHAVILITHRIAEVLQAADAITVLRGGRKVAELAAAEASPEELSRLMIGREVAKAGRARHGAASPSATTRTAASPAALRLDSVRLSERGREKLSGISLEVHGGEILGIAGIDGNGQRELAECVLGLRRSGSGSVRFGGSSVEGKGVAARARLGLAYVPDDRHRDGLVLDMDLAENFALKSLDRPGLRGRLFLNRSRLAAAAAEAIRDYGIKASGPSSGARLLSGGNQQKLILARELAGSPSIVVVSQPTRGLDVGAAEFVRERLIERRDAGAAILLISADLDEILALSDRIAVMHRGRLSESLANDEGLDLTRLGLLMAGEGAETPA